MSVEPGLSTLSTVTDRQMLSYAIANLLQNAFKFTHSGGHVSLTARGIAGHVLIEVADQCEAHPVIGVNYFCRLATTILAGSMGDQLG